MTKPRSLALVALGVYVASIPLANYAITHWGDVSFAGGPHTVPVGFGYVAPSGVLFIGVALVARDVVQRAAGQWVTLAAILVGAALSYLIAPSLAWASAVAFLLGELADFAVYTPLARRQLYAAVLASGLVGALVDSLVFLQLAFHSTRFWQGNTLGKAWMSLLVLPVLPLVRRAVPDHSFDPAGA